MMWPFNLHPGRSNRSLGGGWRFFLILPCTVLLCYGGLLDAANYQWIQTDWYGGATTGTTGHDAAQPLPNGQTGGQTNWNQYSSKDPDVIASTPGELSLSVLYGSWIQTTDADFSAGTRTNLKIVGTGDPAYLTIDYGLNLGTGVDGDLVVDGLNAANNPDGQVHDASNPYLIDTAKEYTSVTVQNNGVISVTPGVMLASPGTPACQAYNAPGGPTGVVYYIVTAIDDSGFETRPGGESPYCFSSTPQSWLVNWSPVVGAAGYRVYRTATSGAYTSPALVCDVASTSCVDDRATRLDGAPPISTAIPAPSTTPSSTGGNLANGTYYYVLTAIDYWGRETVGGTEKSVSISYGTNTASVSLSWTAVPRATGYRVYRSTMQSGVFNSPSRVCETPSGVLSCLDGNATPMAGAPPWRYPNALGYGILNFRVSGVLTVENGSAIQVDGRGYPGGSAPSFMGSPGYGPGAAGNLGAGGGYGTEGGGNNSTDVLLKIGSKGYPYGDPFLSSTYRGSGGASGYSGTGSVAGVGGGGGGGVRISAGTLSINGRIGADGQVGESTPSRSNYEDPGGGGSGGSIFLDGNTLSVGTTGQIVARGGAGGQTSGAAHKYTRGGAGGEGRSRLSFYSNAGVDTGIVGGRVVPTPVLGAQGRYQSPVQDLGITGIDFMTLVWTGTEPADGRLKFQIATSADNQTWTEFRGEDGANNTFYTRNGTVEGVNCTAQLIQAPDRYQWNCPIHSGHDGHRYVRFKAWIEAQSIDPSSIPVLDRVEISYQFHPALQFIVSSPYDTCPDGLNCVPSSALRRLSWDPPANPSGTVVGFQVRTAADLSGLMGAGWYGRFGTTLPDCSSAANDCTATDIPVPNGDFELCTVRKGAPPSWSVSSTASAYCHQYGTGGGSWESRALNGGYLYQSFTLSAGGVYTFNVWARSAAPAYQSATFLISSAPGGGTTYCSATTTSSSFVPLSCQIEPTVDTTVYLNLKSGAGFYEAAFDLASITRTQLKTAGISALTVTDAGGFAVGDRVTLSDRLIPSQEALRRVTAVDPASNKVTLDRSLDRDFAPGSVLANLYIDPEGKESVADAQRDGINDRWLQYRVILGTEGGIASPVLYEDRIDYAPASWVYQPDGVIGGNGDNVYGGAGTGGGGDAAGTVYPGVSQTFGNSTTATYPVQIQNDGVASGLDTFTLTWNTPS
ncbi:MAG: hypothetical protein HY760_02235, partial [Nitrospirae bacterium]|nr:hypothetical protein [Nitrospirota bacterium]